MLSAKDLSHCIDILAELNVNANHNEKKLLLEVGYILKQELEIVNEWDKQFVGDNRMRGHQIDVKKLIEDNTQLFRENQQLHEINMKLKNLIDRKIPQVEYCVRSVNDKITNFTNILSKM